MINPSRYHLAEQADGRGWMLLRLDELGAGWSTAARVVECNLAEGAARQRLFKLRAAEVLDPNNSTEPPVSTAHGFEGSCEACRVIVEVAERVRVPLAALQREASEVNELNGVVAFCAGVLAEIQRCGSIEAAKTVAEMGMQSLEERQIGLWRPGLNDDPADWRRR